MKKMLLILGAALASSIITSQAQVYSQNVVGYVNSVLQPGYNLVANPLSTGTSNGVNEIFANINDGDTFVMWNGAGFSQVEYSPFSATTIYGLPTPWFDPNNPTVSVSIPKVAPGQAFFYYNSVGVSTNTVTGTVVQSGTNVLVSGYNMVGSILPISSSVTNSTWNLTPSDGDIYVTWTGAGYNQVEYSPFSATTIYGLPTPWFDPNNPTVSVPPPTISVGQGFFYYNGSGVTNWIQALQLN